ncbi:putative transcription factor bZIP family [Helianthus anomalus]
MLGEPSPLSPTQVSNAHTPHTGSKSMSIAALDAAIEYEIRMGTLDPNMDKKHMRRIISNRYAAKKAHDKKINKIVGLENHHKELENTIATLRPKVEQEQHFKSHLRVEKEMLVQRLQITTEMSKQKDAEFSMYTMERGWLMGMLGMLPPPPPPYNYDAGPSGL